MRRGKMARVLAGSLAGLMLTAAGLTAQPLLETADTYRAVPFVSAHRLALTADGKFLYASSRAGLTVARRGPSGEPLEVLASYFPLGGGGVLEGVEEFALSPDEAHVYIPGVGKLVVMARDRSSGLLDHVQTLVAGEAGLPDFDYLGGLVSSPLGDFVYFGWDGADTQRLLVMAREPADGTLTLVQDLAAPAQSSAPWIEALVISPGGEHLYSVGIPAVSTFARDPASGRLAFVDAVGHLPGAEIALTRTFAGAISPDGRTLYLLGTNACYNSCRRQAVAVLARDPASGRLELLEHAPGSISSDLTTLALSADGRHLYLADLFVNRSRLMIFAVRPDGRLERQSELLGQQVSRFGAVTSMALDADGRTLVPSGLDARPLPLLRRDPATGALASADPAATVEAIAEPWDMVSSPDGEHLYVSSSYSQSIAVFGWDDATGAFEPLATTLTSEPALDGLGLDVYLAMSPDGRRLYAAGTDVVSFARGADGELEPAATLQTYDLGIGGIQGLAVFPGSGHLYLLGYRGIGVVSTDPDSDELTAVQATVLEMSIRSLDFSPDGAFAYATTFDCDLARCEPKLLVFERDPATGALALLDTLLGPGSTRFESLREVVVSPDGQHVYVGSVQQGIFSIAVFERDPDDGSLAFVELVDDGEPTDGAAFGNRPLAIAPDGRHLYAAKPFADALAVFERTPGTGRLTLLETLDAAVTGAGGLARPVAVAVRPDSQLVFAAGARSSAVSAFSRRCLPDAGACSRGDRFRLDVAWRDFDGHVGRARHLAPTGDSSRIFWFFEEDNWEMMVKVLDGCEINDRFWVYAAATTDVETELTVTDTWTGRRRTYASALGEPAPAVTDDNAFSGCDAPSRLAPGRAIRLAPAGPPKAGCGGGPGLCVADRFDVRVEWRDDAGRVGAGRLVPLESETSGVLWFFDRDNWEMMVKVLDGCEINNRVWVFAAAATDVETKLTVTDRLTGDERVYRKPLGVAAPALTDTDAFVCREPRD